MGDMYVSDALSPWLNKGDKLAQRNLLVEACTHSLEWVWLACMDRDKLAIVRPCKIE